MKSLCLYCCTTLLATVLRIAFVILYYNRYNTTNEKTSDYLATIAAAHRPGGGRQVFALSERDVIILKNAPFTILSVLILSAISLVFCLLVFFIRKQQRKSRDTGKYVDKRERAMHILGYILAILLIICTAICVFATVTVTFSATSVTLRNVDKANEVHGNSQILEHRLHCQLDCHWSRVDGQRCTTCKTVIESAMLDSKFIFVCLISLIIEAIIVLLICPCLNARKTKQPTMKCYRIPNEIINPLLLLDNGSKETLDSLIVPV